MRSFILLIFALQMLCFAPSWVASSTPQAFPLAPARSRAPREPNAISARSAATSIRISNRALDSFIEWAPEEVHPPGLEKASAILDPVRRRIVVFGGFDGSRGCGIDEVWTLGLDDIPRWTPLPTTEAHPESLWRHSAVYDPVRDRMIVFGGILYCDTGLSQDVWSLDLSVSPAKWMRLPTAGPLPSGRELQSAIYDPIGDRMIVFGGYTNGGPTNETWILTLADPPTWSPLVLAPDAPQPAPPLWPGGDLRSYS